MINAHSNFAKSMNFDIYLYNLSDFHSKIALSKAREAIC